VLDLQRYFTRLLNHDQIQKIYYLTAKVVGPTLPNQEIYLRALATLPLVEVRLGRFKFKELCCRVQACSIRGDRFFKAPEEKQTDVAIGIQMLEDAYQEACDKFVIVSGDSDLLPAVHAIKRSFPRKTVVAYVPARHQVRGAATEIRAAADKDKTLPLDLVARSPFPPTIPDGHGGTITKPPTW
jgi:hypothetical protein